MKSLKKVLAVALVVALAFSLVTIASAATVKDYSDASSIKQTEAVDLFTQLGFLQGYNGAFDPSGTLTREQAAKIIAYVLVGSAKADAMKVNSTSFSDVASSRWSAGYIQYCANIGIINGIGNGQFNPEGKLTASQFAKMLLCAIGYGKAGEYIGPNWELNVIADATRLGIFSLNVDLTAPATREQAAQYAFNAYCFISQVVYNGTTKSYQAAFNTVDPYVTISVASTLAYQQGVYSNYTILNGHAYRYWYLGDGTVVSGYYLKENLVATSADGTSITRLTTPTDSKYKGVMITGDTQLFYNGGPVSGLTSIVKDGQDLDTRAKLMGVVVQLIKTNGDSVVDIVNVTEKEVLQLGSAPVVNATSGNVTIPGIPGLADYKAAFVDGYAGLAAGDWVLWYKDVYGTYHVEKAQTVTGQMTSFTPSAVPGFDTMVFGGALRFETGLYYTNTGASDTAIANFATAAPTTANYNADATAWLDNGGNVIYMELNAAAPSFSYGLVLDYQYYGALANSALVKLFKDDGTVGVYSVAANNFGIVPNQSSEFDFSGTVYGYLARYMIDASGKATLIGSTAATYGQDTLSTSYAAKGVLVDGVSVDEQLTAATKIFYFDTSAAYNPMTNPAYVTTGTANTSGMTAGSGAGFDFAYFKSSSSYDVAGGLLFNVNQPVYAGSSFVYVIYPSVATHVVSGITYYDYTVFVDGTMKTVTSLSATEFGSSGLWCYKTDSNGAVIPGTSEQATSITDLSGAAGAVTAVSSTYVSWDSTASVVVDSNTKFYMVSSLPVPFGMVTASTLAIGYNIEYVQMNSAKTAAAAIYFTA